MAISGRHCRSERAIVKTVRTSDLSLRGGRRPTWQSREGTPDPYRPPLKQCWPPDLSLRGSAGAVAILGRHPRSAPAAVKTVLAPPTCHCEEAGGRRGNLAVLARITEKLRRIRPPERQSKHETVLCLPFDQQRKYCPVHRHDKRPAKKIVRTPRRPCRELYKAISCS